MGILYILIFYIIIGASLLLAKAIVCRVLGIYHHHYQIGYSPTLFSFKLYEVRFSLGIIIPLPWLFKIYEIHDGEKRKPSPIWLRREHSFIKRFAGIISGLVLLYAVVTLLNTINYYNTERSYLSVESVNKNGVYAGTIAQELGFKTGDKILKVDGRAIDRFYDITKAILLDEAKQFTIKRNDSIQDITIDNEKARYRIVESHERLFYPILSAFPIKLDSVIAGRSASMGGLRKGDEIITMNGDTILYQLDFTKLMHENKNTLVNLGINRNNSKELIEITLSPDENGKLGVLLHQDLEYTPENKSFLKALNSGNRFIILYLQQLKLTFGTPENSKVVGGFSSISSLFPNPFPSLSVICFGLLTYLALSLFPTPFTEGRFLIALYLDKVVKLPRGATNWIGWLPFIILMVYANGKDLVRLFSM